MWSLIGFLKLSLASAVMYLELWYYIAVILMVRGLKNPAIAVDGFSICMNFPLWTLMIALGFNAAVSVQVSNELGPGCPKAAKPSIVVTVLTSATFEVLFTAVILVTKNDFPKLFTTKRLVLEKTSKLGWVAVGASWQFLVAFINTGCYYVVGLPIGALLGYAFKLYALQAGQHVRTWGGPTELQRTSPYSTQRIGEI
ncbi:unnamed protein product [Camellia sinensis]